MWYWFKKFFVGCDHKWVDVRYYKKLDKSGEHVADQYIRKCSHCGKMKEETFY